MIWHGLLSRSPLPAILVPKTKIGERLRDVYANVSSLMEVEASFVRIHWRAEKRSKLAVIAPHAGRIEPATGELARAIAGDNHRLYCFSGRADMDNFRLHVTSTRFSEPFLDEVLRGVTAIVAVHGCREPHYSITMIGGTNRVLRHRLSAALTNSGFAVEGARSPLEGVHPSNVTNRALNGGVQLELSRVQRDELLEQRLGAAREHGSDCFCAFCRYVGAVRSALHAYDGGSIATC